MTTRSPRPKTKNKPEKKYSTHRPEGTRSQEVIPRTKKKRAKNGLHPYTDIICATIYPQWNGKISGFIPQGGSAFHKTNTNSLLCHAKGMSIVFYFNSGCFQINKRQNNLDGGGTPGYNKTIFLLSKANTYLRWCNKAQTNPKPPNKTNPKWV